MTATAEATRLVSVRLTPAGLEVTRLVIADPDVLRAARSSADRGDDLIEWLVTALRAGAVAITAAGSGSDLTRLQQALERVAVDVDGRVRQGVDRLEAAVNAAVDPHHGQLAAASQAAVTRLAEGVGKLLTGPEATVPATVQAAVRAVTDTALAEITRSLSATAAATHAAITADRDAVRRDVVTAVNGHFGQLSTTLNDIRADVAVRAAVTQARGLTSIKGVDYELDCLTTLGAVAVRAGDGGATRVAAEKGHDGLLVGDLVVHLSSVADPAPILVVECKARTGSNRLSTMAFRRELAVARSNRLGTVSMGLCPPDCMPVPGQRLIVLDERSIIVGHDPAVDGPDDPVLGAAYLLLRLIATTIQIEHRDGVDLGDARRQLNDLKQALEPIDRLDVEVGKINKSAATVRQTAAALRNDLLSRMEQLQHALTR